MHPTDRDQIDHIARQLDALLAFARELEEIIKQAAPMLAMLAPGVKIPGLNI